MKNGQEESHDFIGEKYKICGQLGKGGGGAVYRVYDTKLDKYWAAKKVKKNSPGMEDRALGKVNGSAFPRIVDVVEEEDSRFLIMDWIEGENLEKRLERMGPLPIGEAVRTGIALCDAIASLHEMQPPLLYLDCKPSNIIADKEGKLWLIDFGSAVENTENDAEPFTASPGFAAPEQVRRRKQDRCADARTDVFGLGRTLYALLTAYDLTKPPYAACRLADCNSKVPKRLARIVEKCVETMPERRYQTMRAVKEELQAFQESEAEKYPIKKLFPMVTWLILGIAVWRALQFYQLTTAAEFDRASAVCALLRMIILAAAAFLWQRFAVERTGDEKASFEILQSVLRTQKGPGRWLISILLLCFLAAVPFGEAFAQEENRQPERFPVILRDSRMRKLLLREGSVLTADESLYLELDPSLFEEGKELEIHMTAGNAENGIGYEYVFRYCPGG